MEKNKIIVQNRRYSTLFEGHFKLPLSGKKYMYIMDNIAYEPDERFSTAGGVFWLYNDGTIPLTEKDIDHALLSDYYNRLTSLLKLCDGVAYADNNPLMK